MQPIELTYCTLSFTGNMVTLKIKDGAAVDAAEAAEIISTAIFLAQNKPYVILTDARVFFNVTPEAKKILADKNVNPLLKANAVVINNLPARLIANFFGNFYKPYFKFKIFTSIDKAKEWLNKESPGSGQEKNSTHYHSVL